MLKLSTAAAIRTATANAIGAGLIVTTSLLFASVTNAYADGALEESTPKITRTDVERRINMAERLLDKSQYEEAIRNLNLTVDRYRYSADAWNLLGYAHRQSGNLDTANAAYSRALAIDRYHLRALEYQAELFISMGKLDDAKVNLRIIDELCPIGCKEQTDLQAAIAAAQ